jgi:hypothetical protein
MIGVPLQTSLSTVVKGGTTHKEVHDKVTQLFVITKTKWLVVPHQGDLDTERCPRRRQRRQGTHQDLSSKSVSRTGSRVGVGEPDVC